MNSPKFHPLAKCFETNEFNIYDAKEIETGEIFKRFVLKEHVKDFKSVLKSEASKLDHVLQLIHFEENDSEQIFYTKNFNGQLFSSLQDVERLAQSQFLEYLFAVEFILSEIEIDISPDSVFIDEFNELHFIPINLNRFQLPSWSEKTLSSKKKYHLYPLFSVWKNSFASKPLKRLLETDVSLQNLILLDEIKTNWFQAKIVSGKATLSDLKLFLDEFSSKPSNAVNYNETSIQKNIIWKLKEASESSMISHFNDGISTLFVDLMQNEFFLEGYRLEYISVNQLESSKFGLIKKIFKQYESVFKPLVQESASELVKFYCRKHRIFPDLIVTKSFDYEIDEADLLIDNFIHFFSEIEPSNVLHILISEAEELDDLSRLFIKRYTKMKLNSIVFFFLYDANKGHRITKFLYVPDTHIHHLDQFSKQDLNALLIHYSENAHASDILLESVYEKSDQHYFKAELILNWLKFQKNMFNDSNASLNTTEYMFSIETIWSEKLKELSKFQEIIVFVLFCKRPVKYTELKSFFSNNTNLQDCLDVLVEQNVLKVTNTNYSFFIEDLKQNTLNSFSSDLYTVFIDEFNYREELFPFFDIKLALKFLNEDSPLFYELFNAEVNLLNKNERYEKLFFFISPILDSLSPEIISSPLFNQILLVAADVSFLLGKFQIALNYYNLLIEKSTDTSYKIIECHLNMDSYGEVEKQLNHLSTEEKTSTNFIRYQSLNQLYQRNNIVAKTLFTKYVNKIELLSFEFLVSLKKMSQIYLYSDLKDVLEKLLSLTKETSSSYILSNISEILGEKAFNEGLFVDAKKHFSDALILNEEMFHYNKIAFIKHFLGIIAELENKPKEALDLFYSAASIFMRLGDYRNEANSRSSLSIVLRNTGYIKESLIAEKKSLHYFKENQQFEDVIISMTAIGHIYSTVYCYTKAELFFSNAMNLALAIRSKSGVARCYLYMALYNSSVGNFKRSNYNLVQGLNLLSGSDDENYIHYIYYKSLDHIAKNEYNEAKQLLINTFKMQLVKEYPRYEILLKKLLAEALIHLNDVSKAESILEVILNQSIKSENLIIQLEIYFLLWKTFSKREVSKSNPLKKLILKLITEIESHIEDQSMVLIFRESHAVHSFLSEISNGN